MTATDASGMRRCLPPSSLAQPSCFGIIEPRPHVSTFGRNAPAQRPCRIVAFDRVVHDTRQ
eukprot:3164011-Prymnesium_polylepis.1